MTARRNTKADSRHETGGSIMTGPEDAVSMGPAFTFEAPKSMPLPVLIAVPHAGRAYPSDVIAKMRDPEMSALRLEDRYVDLLAKQIVKQVGTGLLISHAPRAMLDLNRARDDIDHEMLVGPVRGKARHSQANRRARNGLGLVPRRLPGFGEIWNARLTRDELSQRIDTIHRPYHAFLARELEQIRNQWGAGLLIDLHSMPPLRRRSHEERAPELVIGDRFGASCHNSLIARAFRYLDEQGSAAAHNRPYSGGYVLERHASPIRGVHAIQIEVCRATYLDDRLAEPSPRLPMMAQMLAGLVRELGAETARLGDGSHYAQAAE